MSIEIEHNGHTIRWNEGKDTWECYALKVEHPKLTVVKTKINQIDAETRRVNNVEVIALEGYMNLGVKRVTVTLIDDEKHVWTVEKRGNQGASRSKEPITSLIEDTPANRALILRAKELDAEADAARKVASEAWKALPRLTLERLKELNIKPEEKVAGEDECPKPKTKRR